MADALPMALIHDAMDAARPVVLVQATADAEAVCRRNGLTFAEMIE